MILYLVFCIIFTSACPKFVGQYCLGYINLELKHIANIQAKNV